MRKAILITCAVFFLTFAQSFADWTPPNVEIEPETPDSSDIVSITLSGQWGSSCVPDVSSAAITDYSIPDFPGKP